jgi:hypothetical protein
MPKKLCNCGCNTGKVAKIIKNKKYGKTNRT